MATLKEARETGALEQFIANHEGEECDEALFNATLAAMAGTSKAVPVASDAPHSDD
jgi:hypothetical protein